MLLNFFLENQRKLTAILKNAYTPFEMKDFCESCLDKKNALNSHEFIIKHKKKFQVISHEILDEDFLNLFHQCKTLNYSSKNEEHNKVTALFTSPLNENWKERLTCQAEDEFSIRTGFYQDEYDIYESILLGFNGLTIYTHELDEFQIQYLTEISKDYMFTLFFIVHDKEELNCVLNTESQNILISSYDKKNFSIQLSPLFQLTPFIPKKINIYGIGSKELLMHDKKLIHNGFSGIIV